jgi:hypothetical protein
MADPVYTRVRAELQTLTINTDAEVHDFRVPGERRSNSHSPTAGHMATVLSNVGTNLGRYFISRRQVRSLANRLLQEGRL